MVQRIRAIYEHGQLRLLDPVDLSEGEQVNITIRSDDKEIVRAALGDLLVQMSDSLDVRVDEAALAQEIEEAFSGLPPLSETILEDRRQGP